MFLWTRPFTTQILTALLTSEAPYPDLAGWKKELCWDICLLLPLAVILGQVYVRVAASFGVPIKALKKICPPAFYTTLVQCVFADIILAALLHSVAGLLDLDASPTEGNTRTEWEWNGPFSIFTLRLLFTSLGLGIGEAFFPLVLTGGIACGKSTFSKLFQADCGFRMIDADKIGHLILLPPWHTSLINDPTSLVSPKDSVYVQILETFQDDNQNKATNGINQDHPLLADDKTIDRAKLGARIFAHPSDRKKLNAITHKRIFTCLIKQMAHAIYFTNAPYVCAEVPLLFESGPLRYIFGMVLCVACTPSQQLARLQKRNPELKPEECQKRIDSQMPMRTKVQLADIVLWNDKDYSAPTSEKSDNKETDEDAKKRQQQHTEAMEAQVQKAMTMLEQRMTGAMGISLTKMILLMSGSLVMSTYYKVYMAK